MIYLLGCHHDIQSNDPIPWLENSPEVGEQREHFRQLLERILLEEKVELIAEEWGRDSTTSAEDLGNKHGAGYVDINTAYEDLDSMEIPRNYLENDRYTAEQRQAWLRV